MTEYETSAEREWPRLLDGFRTCVHGERVDDVTPTGEQCQRCDWCPSCEAVREFDLESCRHCNYIWGTQ